MKATTMSRILIALALGSTLTDAHPDRLQCGQELAVGETIMGAAAQAETQFTYANFKLWRKEDPETQLYCTSEFHPGDELQVTLEMSTPDYKWLMTLEHDDFDGTAWHESSYGGFTDACATCGGRRSQGPSCYGNDGPATIKLGSAPLTLRAGFAKSYGQITITNDCVLTPSGTAAPTTATRAPTTAPPTSDTTYHEADVLVIGAGLAGVSAALAAKQADPEATVALLAASFSDVTTAYSGGWLWLPNNGLTDDEDPKDSFVEHASKISYPSGAAPAWAQEGLEAFWENAPKAMASFREAGIDWSLQYDMLGQAFPDYYGPSEDNKVPRGRIVRATKDDKQLSGAETLIAARTAAAPDLELEGFYATGVMEESDGSTTVTAVKHGGASVVVTAKRGVVFATGGKIHGLDTGAYGVDATIGGACASGASTGAAMDAVAALPGTSIVNKGNIWQYEVDSTGSAQWFLWFGQPGGDFIVVDRLGRRVYNEGLSYNQRGEFHVRRVVDIDGESVVVDDPDTAQLYLVYGPGAHATYGPLITGSDSIETTLDAIKAGIEGAEWFSPENLDANFATTIQDTIKTFNEAAAGDDGADPMGRGVAGTESYDSSIAWWQFAFAYMGQQAPAIDALPNGANPLTQPFWTSGDGAGVTLRVRPLNYGGIDTKMGPKTDATQRVMGTSRIFAAGNAAASPFGQTYAAPGNTLGFALVSGYLAGTAAAAPPVTLEWTGEAAAAPAGLVLLPESAENQVLQLAYPDGAVVARSYGGHPWERTMPNPLQVACVGEKCSATLMEGLWIYGFAGDEEAERAAAARFLGQATFGASSADIDDYVEALAGDAATWIQEHMALPAATHRAYWRERAWPEFLGSCKAGEHHDTCEAGHDDAAGRKYGWWYTDEEFSGNEVEFGHRDENGKGMVFTNLALNADDQLRQRVAWSLSQIYIVAVGDIPEARDETEVWLKYYDVFVKHAFGNLRDILGEISASPMMAVYLTFRGSTQYDGMASPDENYAREFMQLFTVGLKEMNQDGTFTGRETYTGDDILTHARAWTGYDLADQRSNIELLRRENYIDDLAVYPERHDPFPKADLKGGYIGDRYPLCGDVDASFGGSFEHMGAEGGEAQVLAESDPLYAVLCAEVDGACTFPDNVAVPPGVSVTSLTVAVEESRRHGQRAVFKFAPPKCVELAFFDGATRATAGDRAVCVDPSAAWWHTALTTPGVAPPPACLSDPSNCGGGNGGCGGNLCLGDGDCDSDSDCAGDLRCGVNNCGDFRSSDGWPSNSDGWDLTDDCCYSPTPILDVPGDSCDVKVQVHKTGAVNVVHEPSTAWELSLDSNRLFRVPWAGAHPTADTGCGGCDVSGVTCLCDISPSVTAAFDSIPSREAALAKLHIGSPVGDPAASYAVYGESDGVTAYSKTGALDADAIFAVENEIGTTIFLANKVATVSVGGGAYSFRNAPHFLPLAGDGSEEEVVAETQALIDMCFEHPNAAPFFAKHMIQRMVSSNPSPRYVKAVTDAFRSGSYGSFGSGAYGDIGATVAAVLLDREARSSTLLADPTHGRLREPLLKVLQLMRALEFESADGREVELEVMTQAIGQMAHESPSVFSFYYPDFSPEGVVLNKQLYAPEAQLFTGTNLIGLSNGLHSLIKRGLSRQENGFGRSNGNTGLLTWAPSAPEALCPPTTLLTDGETAYLKEMSPGESFATETEIVIDLNQNGGETSGFLRFDLSAFDACKIKSATLRVRTHNPTYGTISAYRARVAWDSSSTWSELPGPRRHADADASFTLTAPRRYEYETVDVTADVKAWAEKSEPNNGWVFENDVEDGWGFYNPMRHGNWATRLTITTSAGAAVVDELDILLTEGRMASESKAIIAEAFDREVDPQDRLEIAEELFVMSPEFQATNKHVPGETRAPPPPTPPNDVPFKATVMLFLNGGIDSWTSLVPKEGCIRDETNRTLWEQYADYRGPVTTQPFDMPTEYLEIFPQPGTQPCESFGMHPSLARIKDLYEDGDASWFTNIGPMIEPLTVAERNAGTKRVPPSIGAHDVQQRHAQTVQPDNMNARGVLGRILKSLADPTSDEKVSAAGFSLNGMQKALEGAGAAEVVDLTSNSGGFSGLIDYDKLKDDVKALVDKESSSIFAETYGSLLGPALANAEDVANILDSNDGLTENFPMTGLGNRFRDIARVIAQREAFGLNRAVFFVQIGGFDTHGTLMRLPSLLSEIDDAVGTFADEMKAQGIWEDVAVATMSDFGRTLTPNANPGTDHGWSGQHFVVGGGLEGSQIHGHYPTSFGPTGDRNYNQNRGVLIPTTPWDSMWEPLAKFMGVREEDMTFVIPNRANFPDLLDHGDLFGEGPTAKPVQKPTAAPTIEPDAPCSVAGSRPFNGGTLHCVDIGEGQLVDVLTVTSGQRTCRHTDANSCPAGWDLWVPRSYAHAAAVRAAVNDQRYLNVVGVYRPESGCGACTGTPMNSDAQEAWEAADDYRVAFKSVAGSPWFMRSTTFSEPNGNYVKDCWLTTSWGWDEGIGFRLDDGNCDYCFTDYLCSSNKYGHAPTPSPTQAPTPKTPYPTSKPTVSPAPSSAPTSVPTIGDVCGGETGTFTYDGKELRCIDMGGTIANVLLVEDGKETCHYQDENSCPPGMDIWVPQSYEHAKAVSDAVGGRPWTELTGIYRPADGAGDGNWHETLRDWAMNSESMAMYELEKEGNVGFTSVAPAGTPWFLRKDEWHRPSTGYEAGCWMSTGWWDGVEENHGFRFYDNGCALCFKRYMCSTNVINDWVFSHTPTAVPSPKPTTPKPTVAPVCSGRVGEFEYEGKTLVCLEVDGEIVNYLKVTHGARTCKATDANSCPAGFDIWVPRSYNHAVAVTERVEEPWLKSLVGVYRDVDGAGGGGAVAMTSEAQTKWEHETGEIGWRSTAPLDEPWFLRKADPQRGQPSSRYNAKCWLNAWEYSYSGGVEPDWGFRFYANRCHNCFHHYVCSTNSVEAAPSMKPTVSLQPTTSMKPTATVKVPSPTAADNARLCDSSAWKQHNTHLAIDEADCAAKQTTSEQVSMLELVGEDFTDFELSLDIRTQKNSAGVLFRSSGISGVNDAGYQYFVGIHLTEGGGRIKIGRMENKWTQLDWKAVTVRADEFNRVVVRAIGCEIDVEFDGEPIFKIYDCTFDSGSIALRTYYGLAEFRNLRIHEAFAPTPAPSTATPTISFSEVCEKPGTATYGDKTVHCIEVDGMLLDVLAVENGKTTCRHTDENSCPAGFNIWVPRSYEHAKAVRETFGEASSRLVGIYRDGGNHPLAGRKCGGCTDVAMNSDAQEAYEAEEPINAGFKSVAGAPWFLRSTAMSEPNGDYELGCWLRTWGWQNGQGFYLNDHNCNYCYQTYLCSTNQMADAPTTSPTKVPTLKPTATPDFEIVGVTGSVIVSGLSTKEIEDPAVKIVFEEAITAVAELADAEGTTITVSFDERRRLGQSGHSVQSGEVVANYVIKAPAVAALHLVKLLEGVVEPEVVTHALEHAADEIGGSVVDTFASGKVHTSYVDSPTVDPPIATGVPSSQPTGPTPAPTKAFPTCGVRITRGRYQDPNNFQCVTDPKKTVHDDGKKIAFACCDAKCSRKDADGKCYAGDLRKHRNFAPKDWYEATNVCAAEGKVLCGVDEPCSKSGCSYDLHYQWTGEECQAGDAGLPAACA